MDPQATFAQWCAQIREGDWPSAVESAATYARWLRRGGFPARTNDDLVVVSLDIEQDRYGCAHADGDIVELWRTV